MRKKILIVDDEQSSRVPLTELLENSGYSVMSGSSGIEALEILKNNLPDLIITDIKMPEMDGITLFKKVKKQFPDIPVIIMTAFGSIEGAIASMKSGVVDYILKPLNFDDVLLKVLSVFKNIELNKKLREMELYATISHNIKTLGRVGASNAHKFNNLLTVPMIACDFRADLLNEFSLYLKSPDNYEAKKTLDSLIKEGIKTLKREKGAFEKMKSILKMWMKLAADKPEKEPYRLSLVNCIDTALTLIQHELYDGNKINVEYQDNIPMVFGTYNNLTRLYINLLANATDAIRKRRNSKDRFQGVISIQVSYDENFVLSVIQDNGSGIKEETLQMVTKQLSAPKRVFPYSNGGLYDSYGIVRECKGKIHVETGGFGKGASFFISFPRTK